MSLGLISESSKFTNLYHSTMKCGEIFSRISPNIPQALIRIVQNIHGSLDNCAYNTFKASNTFDLIEKAQYLNVVQDEIFFLYSRIEYLVKAKGLSIGQANEFILELRNSHNQAVKWLNSIK